MPRDIDGLYTLPLPPVISGATIESPWANTTLDDLAVAMQDSLSRSAQGSMQAVLSVVDGTVTAPGLSFGSEANTGLFRAGAGVFSFSVLGTPYLRITSTNGVQVSEDGTNWFDAVGTDVTDLLAGEIAQNAADITQNTTDISTNTGNIATNTGNIATNTSDIGGLDTRVSAIEAADPFVTTSLKTNGSIRHVLGLSAIIDVEAQVRHYVANDSGVIISFTNVPDQDDTELGASYETEGQVVIWNDSSTSIPSIIATGLGTVRTIGEPNATADAAQILTYIMQWRGGALFTTLIWSAE